MPNRATLDVPERPVTPLHFTIEPPGVAERLAELDTDQLLSVLDQLRHLLVALPRVHGCDGFNLLVNDGRYGRQSIGEIPDEDSRLRFHLLGRRGDEAAAPTTILNAPEDFGLERVTEAERTARLALLETDAGTGPESSADLADRTPGDPSGGSDAHAFDLAGAGCSLCSADDQELIRGDNARVIRPRHPVIPANVMLVPLRHVVHLSELSDDEFVGLFRMFVRVAATFGQVHDSTSFNLFANDGKVAGQHVPHLHVHVFGRSEREDTDPYQLLRGLRFNLRR